MKNTTPKVSELNIPEPRVSEQEMRQVISLASKFYADFDSTISLTDLLAAGNAADIPNRFIIAAHQQILDNRNKPKNRTLGKSALLLVLVTSILSIKFNGILLKKLAVYIPALNNERPISPAPYIPPDALYVQSVKSSWRKLHYDGNPIYDVAVYRSGNFGHVTKLVCILPPDINVSAVEAITKGEEMNPEQHLCTPVEVSLGRQELV